MPAMDFVDLLVQEGVAAPPEQIRQVLERADRAGRNPIAALVDDGIVVEDVLAEVLARACGTVVYDLDRHPVGAEVARLVSSRVARQKLLLPVDAPSDGKLKVALVDPFDDEAVKSVEEGTGSRVIRLVGTVSGLRAAIDKAYAGRTTRVVRSGSDSEMAPEITRRVMAAPSETVSLDTAPLHRLEEEATIEQRHEALLLALIERGVLTRADYFEALKRLLSRRRE